MIDLHTHSAFSDGSLNPAELVALAAERGVRLLALTDHDTAAGVPEFLEAVSRTEGIEGIGGIEISAVFESHPAHILGYGLTRPGVRFTEHLGAFARSRARRGEAIARRLRELGMDVSVDEARAHASGPVFGRPHIAAALVEKGLVESVGEAFREYLGFGAPAYVERDHPTAIEATRLLREEGLVPVLAHPLGVDMPPETLDRFVRELRAAGLMGLECYYPGHSRQDEDRCVVLAARHGLLRTGGSDFHGGPKPEIALGTGKGALRVPPALGDKLLKAIKGLRRQTHR